MPPLGATSHRELASLGSFLTIPSGDAYFGAGYGIFYDTGAQVAIALSNPFNGRFNNQGSGAIAPTVQFPVTTANATYVTPPPPS